MLLRQHTDPEFNATWGPYWASMPALHEMFGAELFTDTQLEMLQHARTAAKARAHRDNAEKIYKNSTLASVLGEGVVPLDEFKRAAVLVRAGAGCTWWCLRWAAGGMFRTSLPNERR